MKEAHEVETDKKDKKYSPVEVLTGEERRENMDKRLLRQAQIKFHEKDEKN